MSRLIRTAVPTAILCAMAAMPASAVTINAAAVSSPTTSSSGQLAKAEKQQIKAVKKAEKRARKLCKKRMKKARKLGQTYTCTPSSSEQVVETAVAGNQPVADSSTDGAATAGQPFAGAPSSNSPADGGSSKPPAFVAPPPANGGGNSSVVLESLFGQNSVPGGFTEKTDEGQPMMLEAVAPNTVPEPGSLALLGAGLLGLSFAARRRKQNAA